LYRGFAGSKIDVPGSRWR